MSLVIGWFLHSPYDSSSSNGTVRIRNSSQKLNVNRTNLVREKFHPKKKIGFIDFFIETRNIEALLHIPYARNIRTRTGSNVCVCVCFVRYLYLCYEIHQKKEEEDRFIQIEFRWFKCLALLRMRFYCSVFFCLSLHSFHSVWASFRFARNVPTRTLAVDHKFLEHISYVWAFNIQVLLFSLPFFRRFRCYV